jgi:hypothetical protein
MLYVARFIEGQHGDDTQFARPRLAANALIGYNPPCLVRQGVSRAFPQLVLVTMTNNQAPLACRSFTRR